MLKRIMIAVGVLILILAVFITTNLQAPSATSTKEVPFSVAKGQSAMSVAESLEEEELIRNRTIFYVYAKYKGAAAKIQAGEYVLSPDMTVSEILAILTGGKVTTNSITIRVTEGSTLEDMAAKWAEQHAETPNAKEEFLAAASNIAKEFSFYGEKPRVVSLEGYLFPDTYFVSKSAGPEVLIQKMLDTMDSKITAEMRTDIKAKGWSIYDTLVLASIIEKEVGRNTKTVTSGDLDSIESERKIVSGIFHNRLDINMALQSDATVTYLTKKRNPSASYADLEIDSPYNTYKYPGLPIGPISNPSLSAIEAAIYPTKNDYLYFLTKPDGTAVYGKTHGDHIRNRDLYLR